MVIDLVVRKVRANGDDYSSGDSVNGERNSEMPFRL